MGCRTVIACLAILPIGLLCACSGDSSGPPRSSPHFISFDSFSDMEVVSPDALPFSIDSSSMFTTPLLAGYVPLPGAVEGYALGHGRDDNDRTLHIAYFEFPSPMPEEFRRSIASRSLLNSMMDTAPEDRADVRVLSRGRANLWNGEVRYEQATQLMDLSPEIPPINVDPSQYMTGRGIEREHCVIFAWTNEIALQFISGRICQFTNANPRPMSDNEIVSMLQLLDIQVRG